MKRFILTGAPGAGKTAVIRQLELDGFGVVEEAATDIIALEQARGVAEPWKYPHPSIRLLNYKDGGNCERRTSRTRSSFTTGRQFAPLRWRSSWDIHSPTRFPPN